MLNYIWVGLLVVAMLFAVGQDGSDLFKDKYRNGKLLSVIADGSLPPEPVTPADPSQTAPLPASKVSIKLSAADLEQHFGLPEGSGQNVSLAGELKRIASKIDPQTGQTLSTYQITLAPEGTLPAPLNMVFDRNKTDKGNIVAEVLRADASPDAPGKLQLDIKLPAVFLVKIGTIGQAAITSARGAIELAIGLIGALALWLGLMRVAEKSGLIEKMVAVVRPILRPLFPGVPKDHPAMGMIALNLSANMLGLSNAATPFGIRAMEELQKLNPVKDTASNSMVMLLALNTAGVQIMPSATLVAVMGLEAFRIYFPTMAVTAVCAVIAIGAVLLLQPLYKSPPESDQLPLEALPPQQGTT